MSIPKDELAAMKERVKWKSPPWRASWAAFYPDDVTRLIREVEQLESKVKQFSTLTRIMLDGYSGEHPLSQEQWETGVVFAARKAIENLEK